jgi:hypothetical protein
MRKILLLSVALLLVCSLIAAGAVGNSNSKLQLSAKKVAAKVSTSAKMSSKTAPVEKIAASKAGSPSVLPTSNKVTSTGKALEASKQTVQVSPKEAGYLKDHATAISYLQTLPVVNNVAPPAPPQIQTVYLSEGFENGGSIPAGWTDSPGSPYPWLYNNGTGGSWMPGSVHGGSYCAYFDIWDYSIGATDSLMTPVINLSGNGNYQLIFWNWDNTDPNGYQDTVAVHIKYGAGPWTWLYKVPNATSGWTQNVVNFSTAETSIQIEFIGWGYYGYTNPCLDDILVQDPVLNGRCCYGDPRAPICVDNVQQDCIDLGGTWSIGLSCANNPCVPVPPNDRCEWVTPVPLEDGQTLTFSGDNTGATSDGDCPAFAGYPEVWHAFTITECMNVSLDFCGMPHFWGNTWLNLAIGCPCSGITGFQSYNRTDCAPDSNWTIHFGQLAPGTYYVPVMLDPAHNAGPGPYTLHVTGVACPPPPPADFQVTAPGTWTQGNTCGAGDDCNLRVGEDQIWQITIPEDGQWIFSLCNTLPSWDTYIYLGTGSCMADIAYNDDGGGTCGLLSKITVTIPAGVYYLDVEPYTAGTCNPYQLDVTEVVPCVVTCPPNAVPEGEPDCYDGYVDNFNGGCNSTPNIWSEVSPGETICGTAGIYTTGGIQLRDTDWYHFTVPQDTIVSVIGVAQFPIQMLILNYDCANILQYAFASVVACDTARMSVTLPAGDYTVWAGPSGSGVPCGSPYWFTLNFIAPPPPPPPDFQVTAPGTWTDGNTCGAGNDCSLRPSEDQIWEVTIPTDGIWTFGLCATSPAWDTYIYLGTTACSADIAENDDGCGYPLSKIGPVSLTAGTYYLTIEGFSSTYCGAYQLDITEAPPCIVTCPPNATPEGEPVCFDGYVDNFNGGCNSTPNVYSEVTLGETVCGAGGDYVTGGLNYRDTDWYHFNVSQDTTVNIVAVAGFPLQLMLLNYDCANIQVLGTAFPAACDTGLITVAVPAGDYTVWVGEATGIGTPCGTPYWFTLTALTPPPPPPTPCEGTNVAYSQADDGVNTLASQCDAAYPFTAGMADDFILPGSGSVNINEAVAYVGFWNGSGGQNPDNLLGFGVTIYADNAGVPGGQPIDGDPNCGHQANIDGGIVYTHDFAPGEFTWSTRMSGAYQVELPLPAPVTLTAGTTYWIEFYPHMSFSASGQVGCFATSAVTGAVAVQGFPLLGIPYWTTNSTGVDVAFCLLSAPPVGCFYMPGDINGNHSVNGVDIVYAVNYFKGSGPNPPIDCFPSCPLTPNPFFAAGDVNGNCAFNGIDITYFVRYLKGQVPSLLFCADCPPAPGLAVTPKLGAKVAPKNIGGQQ